MTITTTTDAWRPSAHFTARSTWLNDPNGLLFHNGTYHLFFQNNPTGSTWGNISWGHATSTDLVSWSEQPVAIPVLDGEMAFSGSAVADVRNTAGFAGPGETALVAVYTAARDALPDGTGASQAQALAYSVDDGATWTRYAGNPVLDIGSAEFRDPKVFWFGGDDGHWVMVAVEAVDRRVAVYTSPDLIAWTRRSHFGPAHATGGVWECPDLFPLRVRGTDEVRWMMIVSLNPGGIAGGSGSQYFLGDFDGAEFTADRLSASEDPADYDWLDYGRDYYAAVSFNDAPEGRRLTIAWASNWDYANETPTGPWRSSMSLVRELDLVRGADGRLRLAQRAVLPTGPASRDVRVFDVDVSRLPGDRTELRLLTGTTDDEVVLTVDGDEGVLTCDRTRSGAVDFAASFPSVDWAPLPAPDESGRIPVRIVVDASVVEVFLGGGLSTLTQLVFPSAPFTTLQVRAAAE
ncbi:glycosyl hydrolase family 32 [Rathayibacter sp. AY2B7]|uniref:glycoside hydrolase family 32 protein n=1 Tax=Rathayibacter sp. AY2B7 TaxID=2080571 RepID=UPI000CE7C7A0|nr:glycoside hydrolase family 32 protein [Rathayibacter sp. AY2B7]PPG57944.1 glycosyl hydrolase family 32 [Rathayibacter sp. AY2B7]